MTAASEEDRLSAHPGLADARARYGLLVLAREKSLRRERTWALPLERLLWATGLIGLLLCLTVVGRMLVARRSAAHIVTMPVSGARPLPGAEPSTSNQDLYGAAVSTAGNSQPAVVGRVEIPAIGMTTPLLAGDDSMSLTQGAGHIPGTAYPGGLGTVGIAGHRDTHFRSLKNVARGMDVRLIDRTGIYHYSVTSSEIVTPDQVSVLDIVSEPGLVLITCYPFRYVGSAPKRFVVHARLVSMVPDEAPGAGRKMTP